MSNEATANPPDDLSEFDDSLTAAKLAAADAIKHEAEWSHAKSIKKGSALAAYVDEALTTFLTRRVDESAKDAARLETQVARMRIADEQRALKAQIAANEAKLKALTS